MDAYQIEIVREVEYAGKKYDVIMVLDNDLLLVVSQEDINNNILPLQTFVLPDYEVINLRNKIQK
ncbi:hypothetical protein AB1K32_15040 [Metabacillus dongyingensis]|uniref:hypothetical protein n=1 Tax=Metabacillus dongyingensis TaxID=2874282 RepID=UPI003B8C7C17